MTVTAGVQLSAAVATPSSSFRYAEQVGVVTSTSGGIVSTGGVVSPLVVMVITCVQETLPRALLAVHVMLVCPAGNGSITGVMAPPSLRVASTIGLSPPAVGVPIWPAVRVF
jgi:hypothetical protein